MSTFEVYYARLAGLGETTRCLLDYADAKWTNTYMEEWAEIATTTPYGKVPVLRETTTDGQHIELCESRAIERYLARRFGLYSDDLVEAARIDAVASQFDDAMRPLGAARFGPEAARPALMEHYRKEVTRLFTRHGAQLAANGNNGHYFGDRTTWADIVAYMGIRTLGHYEPFDEELWALKTKSHQKLIDILEADPNFRRYLERSESRLASYVPLPPPNVN
ncbi:hypothetical protein H4R33_003511 [Dimargaris cristalligena]|uniref:Glutathione S-transferase n=1 Tax=Dimargaris cristalligena TaxID=215637 RepID=A0A4P9ZW41_9FUNG|nr:hypothetical protein H4R33_003511 [Dimargaris cristalligena]RKP37866.1 hypothetical protein BJ085DRAFT_31302 [Dimargaris cristalligena]|eukprot:RKP37866.1 hypothetical protein BJ085DRAFT_31302 [Dimargaris cristalligena]